MVFKYAIPRINFKHSIWRIRLNNVLRTGCKMNSLSDIEREEREQLLREMHQRFESVQQIEAVRKKMRAWLKKHPDDERILGEGECLVMLEKAMKITRK